MAIAESVASLSKDVSTKVGAIALDEKFNVLATGYNGFARGVDDAHHYSLGREHKYVHVIHAEGNLVASAARNGHALDRSTVLVTPLFPCSGCAKLLIQAGIKRVVGYEFTEERWAEENKLALEMFKESGVEVVYLTNN